MGEALWAILLGVPWFIGMVVIVGLSLDWWHKRQLQTRVGRQVEARVRRAKNDIDRTLSLAEQQMEAVAKERRSGWARW